MIPGHPWGCPLRNLRSPPSPDLCSFLFASRVTLYAEFLPMKARAKCILLIEVRRREAGPLEEAGSLAGGSQVS